MKKSMLSIVIVMLIAGFSVLWSPLSASAGEPTEQVRETVDAVMKILNNDELKKPSKEKERRAGIRQAVVKHFDFEEMAKRSLSSYWKERTPAEQKEFVTLYSDLLENTYIRKIERYENEKVVYTDERLDGNYAVVKTKIVNEKGLSIPVDYRIFREKETWEVYDIVVEGISLVNNYRTQFTQIIRAGSYSDLVKRLKDKANK